MPLDLVVVGPSQDSVRGQLGTVVADDGLGLSVRDPLGVDNSISLASHPKAALICCLDHKHISRGGNGGTQSSILNSTSLSKENGFENMSISLKDPVGMSSF